MKTRDIQGFTLIELAVVLVIVSVILSGFLGSLSSRVEQARYRETRDQLKEINLALLGFASAEGRLPCPTRATDNGQEQPIGGGVCTYQHGFIPGRTLGLSGAYNRDNLLLDSWGNPIRYSVPSDSSFTSSPGAGSIKDTGLGSVNPDLIICKSASPVNDVCSAAETVTANAAYVVLSLGPDGARFIGPKTGQLDETNAFTDQGENSSETEVTANTNGENLVYLVAGDRVFVSKDFADRNGSVLRYNDIILWASPYVLYSQMMEAGQLP